MQRHLVRATSRRLPPSSSIRAHRRCITQCRTFEEGDLVLLRTLSSDPKLKLLRHPLSATGKVETHKGAVKHADIIGAKVNGVVKSSKGVRFMVCEPTLAEYVTLSSRLVAPIYPDDANLIVNLLDLHPDPADGKRIEIFECGTGHGALTLHLARAIHAANAHIPSTSQQEGWKDARKAVIHTMDISPSHSQHAQKTISRFRNGMYSRNIDFHIGSPSDFFALPSTPTHPFLNHAILDMPGSHAEMGTVAPALLPGGKLVLFAPSITQLIDAQRTVREQDLPLYLERVVELGGGISTGREWSLKFVQSRASMRSAASGEREGARGFEEDGEGAGDVASNGGAMEATGGKEEWVVSCRPKPGKVVQGGGFLGVWSRIEERSVMGDVDTGFTKGMKSSPASGRAASEEDVETESSDGMSLNGF